MTKSLSAKSLVTRSLDLGCGPNPKNPFSASELFGLDVEDHPAPHIRTADLAVDALPFEDGHFDYVTAFDVIEHVPRIVYAPHRRYSFIALMDEIHRVLKPDGLFYAQTPAYPHAEAFQDPTHVNIITENTFALYFDDQHRWAANYGFRGAFRVLSQEWRGFHLLSTLQKAPAPA
ncbi:methyltransferase family protein [Azospirillum baldaniorum]|uniref:methyltransferase domain-containing protein n=1 Tax=Azospirillum baldaniorum TaxID=1064539 RepID=UPI0011A0F3C6|nr:class I SAM-dependent methyltransferase [Azospirillum baldaniorum]TWA60578.1 methyltransferase family protein [Azospirillum baldaniorum]